MQNSYEVQTGRQDELQIDNTKTSNTNFRQAPQTDRQHKPQIDKQHKLKTDNTKYR